MAKTAAKRAPSKSEVYAAIAEETNLSKKEVTAVIDALSNQVKKALSSKGPGVFAIPGLVKITKRKIPAKPARMGRNPATGEMIELKAKPASVKAGVRALKALKDMVK
jgi:nucleoid DNA-binding protein